MKLATRINSFLPQSKNDLNTVFEKLNHIGINYVDLNYPEHIEKFSPEDVSTMLSENNLKLNGLALRFKDDYINGELGNAEDSIAKSAVDLCRRAIDFCRQANGKVVTIWLAHDGFDYSFQINYEKVWNQLKKSFADIADYATPDIKISIEYKPFQPRAYAFIDGMGITGMMLDELNRPNLGVTLDYCHMLMKHENPAFAADIFGKRGQLFGVHLNDGYGLNDDGLMIGTATPVKTFEFLYYLKKNDYDNVIYFDTFPVIENAEEECVQNIKTIKEFDKKITETGVAKIQQIIDQNDAIKANELVHKLLFGCK
ncbi:sugar phosphate isomerase/epimerase family protein [Xylocopilactobacillus apis]|uniref:Xylose isomerase n=1 Tax=Xylocopilactobacillus apis TaxID=2932183 RepID=A0AAU9DQP9_9LACO|nr:sugar phosphate isomerase/epimerase family protein [Xylocopilactobacillus apis]BDR55923.1 xylose isomerase [Xylocopilactobacillus apis]